jgi:putative transposase
MSTKKHDVAEELLSGLLANYKKPEDFLGFGAAALHRSGV